MSQESLSGGFIQKGRFGLAEPALWRGNGA